MKRKRRIKNTCPAPPFFFSGEIRVFLPPAKDGEKSIKTTKNHAGVYSPFPPSRAFGQLPALNVLCQFCEYKNLRILSCCCERDSIFSPFFSSSMLSFVSYLMERRRGEEAVFCLLYSFRRLQGIIKPLISRKKMEPPFFPFPPPPFSTCIRGHSCCPLSLPVKKTK